VLIILAVIRLPSVKTDISISVNVPLRAIISDSLLPLDFSKEDAKTLQEVEEILITTLKDFKIRDWELFS
jgi:antitoxin component of RelBE/YafQ-DinJ toxin-antitoxin module